MVRLRLTLEVLAAYVPMLRLLRREDIISMVATARDVPGQRLGLEPIDELRTAARVGRIVYRVLKVLPTERRCLIRSLVLTRMLARRSIESRLVLGVRGGEFAAHAWVEYDGTPVLPTEDFERLTEY